MNNREPKKKIVFRLFSYIRPYKALTSAALILLTTAVSCEVLIPYIMGETIDSLGKTLSESDLKISSLQLLGVVIVAFFSMISQIYITGIIGQNVMRDMRLQALAHTQKLSLNYLNNTPKGSILSRITNDIETINEYFAVFSTQILKNLMLMMASLIMMAALNWRLGLIALITFLPIVLLTELFRRAARVAYRQVREWTSRVNSFLSEHISAISVVKIFNKEEWSRKQFALNNNGLLKSLLKEIRIFSIFRPLTHMLGAISMALIIQSSGILRSFNADWITAGVLFSFIQLAEKFYRPLLELAENFGIMQSALAGGERVFELLDNREMIPDEGLPIEPGHRITGEIEFKDVHFSYKEETPVLQNISFNIRPGEKVAIVGLTGSGKSTITNLITRLWDADSGSIRIDGREIKEISLESLRSQIITVQQDIFLFSGSVRDNICLGSCLNEEALVEAAKTVNADQFIRELPDGYDTEIIENGENLSTGQKQLLTFARAIAHDPAVVILDEATSNVDTESEQLIQEAMRRLFEKRTSIIIAHRLSTIIDADRILVLSEGKVIEEGRHEELIQRRGAYYNLYLLQYNGGSSSPASNS